MYWPPKVGPNYPTLGGQYILGRFFACFGYLNTWLLFDGLALHRQVGLFLAEGAATSSLWITKVAAR